MISLKDFLNFHQDSVEQTSRIFATRLQLLQLENKEIIFKMLIFNKPLKELWPDILRKVLQQQKQKKELHITKLVMPFVVGT
jgi:hypothetical protein